MQLILSYLILTNLALRKIQSILRLQFKYILTERKAGKESLSFSLNPTVISSFFLPGINYLTATMIFITIATEDSACKILETTHPYLLI